MANTFLNKDGLSHLITKLKTYVASQISAHTSNKSNPHGVTKAQIGLGSVANLDQSKAIKSITRSGTTFTATALDGSTTTFTQQDNNTTYGTMKGASTSAAGSSGLVPAPATGAANRYLRSDGAWAVPPDTDTKYSAATSSTAGLMSAADKSKLDNLQVGGRNLAIGTNNGDEHWSARSGDGIVTKSTKVFSDFGNVNGARFDITKNSSTWGYVSYDSPNIKTILNTSAGEFFTISFDINSDVSAESDVSIQEGDGTNPIAKFGSFSIEPNKWNHVKLTAQAIQSTINLQNVYINGYVLFKKAKYVEIVNLKLERGTVATDWTPAPEDFQSATKSFTLSASSWSSGSYKISDSLITASSNQELLPAVGITSAQYNALCKAQIVDGGQAAGSLTLKALGTTPTIDIPIRVIFRGTI